MCVTSVSSMEPMSENLTSLMRSMGCLQRLQRMRKFILKSQKLSWLDQFSILQWSLFVSCWRLKLHLLEEWCATLSTRFLQHLPSANNLNPSTNRMISNGTSRCLIVRVCMFHCIPVFVYARFVGVNSELSFAFQ